MSCSTDEPPSPEGVALRRWQAEAAPVALEGIAAGRRGVISAVMGAGKSILIRLVVEEWLRSPGNRELGPVVVTTPTIRLVEQLATTLGATLDVGAFYTARKDTDRDVIVCCNPSAPQLAAALGRRVGLWVADEVHRCEAAGLLAAVQAFEPHAQLGFTATPFRSEEDERISVFDEILFTYTPADALRDGVIVPWKIIGWDGAEATLDEACVELIRRHRDGPGIVNATSIADADGFAELLSSRGIRASAIHSNLAPSVQTTRLQQLLGGDIDALVHVNMLSEGVDLPALRWACLRRPVGARVRFVQEVGRVLRSSPGKTHATLLDPNGLFGVFGLSYEAALGWYEEPAAPDPQDRETDGPGEEREILRVRAASSIGMWARQLVLALQAEGAALDSRVQSSQWRSLPPTQRQLQVLTNAARAAKHLPPDHAVALRAAVEHPGALTRGMASDLISLGFALLEHRQPWTPEVPVPAPAPREFEAAAAAADTDVWRCAGIMTRDGVAAVAVVRGNHVAYSGARVARAGDSWGALNAAALRIAAGLADGAPVQPEDPKAKHLAFAEAARFRRSR